MSNKDTLKEIESKLRQADNDRNFLANQLMVLAAVIANGKEEESGLVRGALGGMHYAINRLREIWKEPGSEAAKSLEELEEIYATVELSRFATTADEVEATKHKLRKENLLANAHVLQLEDGRTVTAFSSRVDQTTIDGVKILRGELLEAAGVMVPSFQQVFRELNKITNKPK